jgi:hypothetical protein
MSHSIEQFKLEDFIPIATARDINFAEITYECGAGHKFIDSKPEISEDQIKNIHAFKPFYLEKQEYWISSFFVLALMGKSYVMYEVSDDKISILVGYTHESARKQGYITRMLKHLTELYPDWPIIGDTFDESLIKIQKSVGIKNFREQKEITCR